MKKILAAGLMAASLAGCSATAQLTPAQDAALVGVAVSTGAAVAGTIKPSIAPQANTVGAAVSGAAQSAGVILTPAPAK